MIDSYISTFDPAMKGVLTTEDINKFDKETREKLLDIPGEIKNDKDQVDFFCFMTYVRDYAVEDFPENIKYYLSTSSTFTSLPADFKSAQARHEVSPSVVLS